MMAAETIVIDIVANFKNQTTPGMSSAKQSADRFTDSVKKSKSELDRLGRTSANPKVNLVDRATSKLSKIDNSLKAISGKTFRFGVKILDYATAPLRAIKNTLFSVKGLVAAIGTGMAANQLLAKPLGVADAYSSAKIGFSNLLGDEAGQKMMDDLDAFAKKTPFDTSGVIANAQKMMAMGWDPADILRDMETIGNAAAATGKGTQGLESIVRALAQIKTKGKLSTEELNQLSEQGIAAKAILAEQLGYGTGDAGIAKMTAVLEKGGIGSDTAIKALLEGMKQFDGMMDKTANETVEGLKAQIADAFEINIVRRWGQGLQDGAKRGLGSVLELLDKSEGTLKKIGDTVYEIGSDLSNWAADKLEGTIDKILKITEREDFKNASIFEKGAILWDEVIAQPFSEWWDSKGKPFMAEKMATIGESMGSGMTKGILALLGVDVVGAASDAVSIGGSFATGFAKGFESKKVWDAMVDALSRAFKTGIKSGIETLFTGSALEKIIVGGISLKILSGVVSGLSAAQTLWKGTGALTEDGALTLGGMGLKGILGSASTASGSLVGSGIIGSLAKIGSFVGSGAYTGGGLALAGLGTIAGGLTTAYGLYNTGKDFYTAYKADDSTKLGKAQKTAYQTSGYAKFGGMATGAAAGAAIGSVVPVIGTLLGGLIGAGAGWLGGKFLGDKEIEKYQELERSTNAAKYNSQEMKDAIMKGSASAEELDAIFQRAVSEDMVKRFGKIELSMEEIERYAKNIAFGDHIKTIEKFASASEKAAQSVETFNAAASDMERLNFDMSERLWKIEAGINEKLSDEEIAQVKERVQAFINSAEQALSDKHYEFNAAVEVILNPKTLEDDATYNGIIESGNALYEKLQKDLDSAKKDLSAQYDIVLEDGIITADEQKIISSYQKKVAEIINKVSTAETEASFEIAKLKFTSGELSAESFTNMQSALNAQIESYIADQDVALTAAVTDIKLQMQEDPANAEKYNQQIQALMDGYNANIKEMKANVEKVQLQGIAEAFDGVGTVEQLQGAINALTSEGKNPINLTFNDINTHLNINEGSLSEEEKTNFTSVMQQALQSSVTGENALKPSADAETSIAVNETFLQEQSILARNAAESGFQSILDANPISGSLKANVSVDYSLPTFQGINTGNSPRKQANGGYIDRPIETIVGEAGPEMIIPLSANRRQRGRSLWERAGRALGLFQEQGIMQNANGGLYGYGSSRIGDMLNNAISARKTEEPQTSNGKTQISVEVGGINIQVASADEIGNVDAMAGKIAKALEKAFQNIPVAVGT